jgi:hypothetical protein
MYFILYFILFLSIIHSFLTVFRTVAKIFKHSSKPPKSTGDDSSPPPVPVKTQQQLSALQSRSASSQQQTNIPLARANSMSKSMTVPNNDSPQIINSDVIHEPFQTKPSMSASSYGSLIPSYKDEQKETNNSSENVSSPLPPVLARTGKAAIGTRVLPPNDPNGEPPPVRLRHFQAEKKGRFIIPIDGRVQNLFVVSLPVNPSASENPIGSDATTGAGDVSPDDNEQYKRKSLFSYEIN